jgi:hypothetical protein
MSNDFVKIHVAIMPYGIGLKDERPTSNDGFKETRRKAHILH